MIRSTILSPVLWTFALIMALSSCLDWDIPDDYPGGDGDGDGDSDCDASEVICGDGVTCIDFLEVCNSYPDCPDASDELNCFCDDYQFRCVGSGQCIDIAWWCDGETDCPDGSDETYC